MESLDAFSIQCKLYASLTVLYKIDTAEERTGRFSPTSLAPISPLPTLHTLSVLVDFLRSFF